VAAGERTRPKTRGALRARRGAGGLSTQRTAGQVGEIRWDLAIDCGERIAPDIFPARLLRMTDLALVSAPLAAFTGQVWLGDERFELRRAPGMLSHYWGRQLAPEWWWVSANQFDRDDDAVECSVYRSALWGIPVGLPLAYLYLRRPDGRMLLMAPPGRRSQARRSASRSSAALLRGEPIRLEATGARTATSARASPTRWWVTSISTRVTNCSRARRARPAWSGEWRPNAACGYS
jgi:hypothetical protein